MGLLQEIREDVRVNHGRRLQLFLALYRIGRRLHQQTQRGRGVARFASAMILPLVSLPYRWLSHGYGGYMPFSVALGRRVAFRHELYGVFISKGAVIGDDSVVLHHVTIGSDNDTAVDPGSPTLGPGVFVGAGAKLIGKITVGAGCRIGANAIVVEDVPPGATAVSPKARVIVREQPTDDAGKGSA